MKTRNFLLTAGILLALAFTLSCSEGSDGNGNISTCGGKEYNTTDYSCVSGELVGSCRGQPYYPEYQYCDKGEIKEGAEISSSSLARSSSSNGGSQGGSSSSSVVSQGCAGFVDGAEREHYGKNKAQFCDERDGQKYVYVEIGTQTWMAENLDYAVEGSKCYGEDGQIIIGWDDDDNPLLDNPLSLNEIRANCEKYGRLYDWATAMKLPSACNSNDCSRLIQPNHQGICPDEWHIPSYDDWEILVNYAGGSGTAGAKLKATNDWNGTDNYGFSALPVGYGCSVGSFRADNGGYWWSASELYDTGLSANALGMGSDYGDAGWDSDGGKSCLFSVRCVKD